MVIASMDCVPFSTVRRTAFFMLQLAQQRLHAELHLARRAGHCRFGCLRGDRCAWALSLVVGCAARGQDCGDPGEHLLACVSDSPCCSTSSPPASSAILRSTRARLFLLVVNEICFCFSGSRRRSHGDGLAFGSSSPSSSGSSGSGSAAFFAAAAAAAAAAARRAARRRRGGVGRLGRATALLLLLASLGRHARAALAIMPAGRAWKHALLLRRQRSVSNLEGRHVHKRQNERECGSTCAERR